MKPTKIEFSIGKTCHQQPLRLIKQSHPGATSSWTLHQDAHDQRDDSNSVSGLTDDNILAMAEAVKAAKA